MSPVSPQAKRSPFAIKSGVGDLSALFAPGSAWAGASHPALLWRGGDIVAANPAAAELIACRGSGDSSLAHALASAASGEGAADLLVTVPKTDGGGERVVSLMLLALGDQVLALGHDLTADRQLRDALTQSRARYRDFLRLACDFAWQTDTHGRFGFFSSDLVLGHDARTIIGRDATLFGLAPDEAGLFGIEVPAIARPVWLRDEKGRAICLELWGAPLFDSEGGFLGARGVCRDITELEGRETNQAEARHRERSLIHLLRLLRQSADPRETLSSGLKTATQAVGAAGGGIWRQDADSGWVREASINKGIDVSGPLSVIDKGPSPVQVEIESHRVLMFAAHYQGRCNGALGFWRESGRGDWDADDPFLLAEVADLLAAAIAQVSGQEQLTRLSETDALTGLFNRRGFERGLAAAIDLARRSHQGGALFFVDFDNFKEINDRHGHAQGDAALKAAADLLRQHLRARDLVGRLGGDEFAIWLPGIAEPEARRKAEQLVRAAEELQAFAEDSPKRLGFSVGVALHSVEGETPVAIALAQLIERADRAMYQVKRAGKGAMGVLLV